MFNYTDHLGNVRLSYFKNPKTNALEVLEENNYYPFGLKHQGYNTDNLQPDFKYKFNNKEFQDELGLAMYDYGARNYDPALGRWINVDALSEDYSNYSPYVYAFNDPIRHVDPDGNEPEDRLGEIDPPGKKKGGTSLSKPTLVALPAGNVQGGYVGQGLDELVTAGIQWLGEKISGSAVSKETSENIQLATSLAVVIVSKGKNAKADGEVVEQLTKTESGAMKKVPNPNGKNGSKAHQEKIAEYEQKLQDKGYEVTRERRVNTEGGHKNTRYTDLTATKR